jgi:hypothetical protein
MPHLLQTDDPIARRVPALASCPLRRDASGAYAVYAQPLRLAQQAWYTSSVRLPYLLRTPAMASRLAYDWVSSCHTRLSRSADADVCDQAALGAAELLLNTSACTGFAGRTTLDGESALRFEFALAPWIPRDPTAPVGRLSQVSVYVRDSPEADRRRALLATYRTPTGEQVRTTSAHDICYLASAIVAYCSHPAVHLHAGAILPGRAPGDAPASAHANVQGLNRAANSWPAHTIGRSYAENRELLRTAVASATPWHGRGAPRAVPHSWFYRAALAAHRTLSEFAVDGQVASQWVAAFVMHDLDHHTYARATRSHGFSTSSFHALRALRHVFIVPPSRPLLPPDESRAQRELRLAVTRAVRAFAPEVAAHVGSCWTV